MPASSSACRISSHARSAPAPSGSTSASDGHVASASPSRIPGCTPADSAAAVTGPSSGSPCGSGASAAGRRVSVGVRRSAAFSSSPGMVRHAIMGTDVLYEHLFPCQGGTINLMERVRVDKWLWAARFAKTRSAATELVLAGHVKVGGERVKPAREVGTGDTVEIRLGVVRHTVVVTGVADRRGPAKVAVTLYEETQESREERERLGQE